MTAAREHAMARQRENVPLGDLVREYEIMRQEVWRALRRYLAGIPTEDVYEIAESLDAALDTMISISTGTYGAEIERSLERTARLQRVAAAFVPALTVAEVARVMIGQGIGALGFREPRTFSAEDRAFALAVAQQCAQALERARLYRRDGSRIDVSLDASPIRNATGRVTGVSWVAHDISEEVRLRRERERLLQEVERGAAEEFYAKSEA